MRAATIYVLFLAHLIQVCTATYVAHLPPIRKGTLASLHVSKRMKSHLKCQVIIAMSRGVIRANTNQLVREKMNRINFT